MNTKHMPASQLPWKLSSDGYTILDAQGVEVMDDSASNPADTAFIVEAVNGYYACQSRKRALSGEEL